MSAVRRIQEEHGIVDRRTVRVDGDERYTESRMTGWFDPPLVLAMREGRVLFINEMNRMPETVRNVLLPALDERLIVLPRLGGHRAARARAGGRGRRAGSDRGRGAPRGRGHVARDPHRAEGRGGRGPRLGGRGDRRER